MTALLIIGIVLCGLAFAFDVGVWLTSDGYDDSDAVGVLNLLPLGLAIVIMSLALGKIA